MLHFGDSESSRAADAVFRKKTGVEFLIVENKVVIYFGDRLKFSKGQLAKLHSFGFTTFFCRLSRHAKLVSFVAGFLIFAFSFFCRVSFCGQFLLPKARTVRRRKRS